MYISAVYMVKAKHSLSSSKITNPKKDETKVIFIKNVMFLIKRIDQSFFQKA